MNNEQIANNQFVSRGGVKLQAALDQFKIDVKGKTVLDVGSSTGGFVDCLLQNGAEKVYALDTCYGELAWKLRNNFRVVVMERTNILHLENLPGHTPGESKPTPGVKEAEKDTWKESKPTFQVNSVLVDLITIDAGWTKLELVLPKVKKFLKKDGIIIALLKPHYEAHKKDLVKGVVSENLVDEIKNQTVKNIQDLGFKIEEVIDSPILGGAGNQEYLLLLSTTGN